MRWIAQIYNEQDCYSYDIDIEADTEEEAQGYVDEYVDQFRGYSASLRAQHEQSSSQLVKRIAKSFAGRS